MKNSKYILTEDEIEFITINGIIYLGCRTVGDVINRFKDFKGIVLDLELIEKIAYKVLNRKIR